jgi:hypothetical protein
MNLNRIPQAHRRAWVTGLPDLQEVFMGLKDPTAEEVAAARRTAETAALPGWDLVFAEELVEMNLEILTQQERRAWKEALPDLVDVFLQIRDATQAEKRAARQTARDSNLPRNEEVFPVAPRADSPPPRAPDALEAISLGVAQVGPQTPSIDAMTEEDQRGVIALFSEGRDVYLKVWSEGKTHSLVARVREVGHGRKTAVLQAEGAAGTILVPRRVSPHMTFYILTMSVDDDYGVRELQNRWAQGSRTLDLTNVAAIVERLGHEDGLTEVAMVHVVPAAPKSVRLPSAARELSQRREQTPAAVENREKPALSLRGPPAVLGQGELRSALEAVRQTSTTRHGATRTGARDVSREINININNHNSPVTPAQGDNPGGWSTPWKSATGAAVSAAGVAWRRRWWFPVGLWILALVLPSGEQRRRTYCSGQRGGGRRRRTPR